MRLISLIKYGAWLGLTALSSTAFAQYYVVYSAPPQTIYIAPTTVVAARPCHVPCYKPRPCHYKKRHHYTQSSCHRTKMYSRQSCNVSVYYPTVPTCNPCISCNNAVWVESASVIEPNFVVTYGPPVYSPDTYHPVEEYSWDTSTGDDFEW